MGRITVMVYTVCVCNFFFLSEWLFFSLTASGNGSDTKRDFSL